MHRAKVAKCASYCKSETHLKQGFDNTNKNL